MNKLDAVVLGGATVTNNLHRACAVLGVTHEEIAARAGCSRPMVTLALQGRRGMTDRIRSAAVALCRERLAHQVDTLAGIVVGMLVENPGDTLAEAALDVLTMLREAMADENRRAA